MATNTTRTVSCPKCSGSGIVQRFGHVKNGVCFDCNGTGRIAAYARPSTRKVDPRKIARAVGDAVMAGEQVDEGAAKEAFEYFEDAGPLSWIGKDCDRRNALGRHLGLFI